MFSLAYDFDDSIEFGEFKADIDMSFDTILRFFDLLADEKLNDTTKVDIALEMLLSKKFEGNYEDKILIFQTILNEMILNDKPQQKTATDSEEQKEYYSFSEDADYIFASFMQDYRMNLKHEKGKLHWFEFKALLTGLRTDTIFKKVVEIRQWKPTKDTDAETKKDMQELQRIYALGVSQDLVEFEAMDLEEKEAYARKILNERRKEVG